jgi:hypothetical protein
MPASPRLYLVIFFQIYNHNSTTINGALWYLVMIPLTVDLLTRKENSVFRRLDVIEC